MIKTQHWMMMSHLVPQDYQQLVSVCYEYEDMLASMPNNITGHDIGKIQILIQRILSEYMKIMQTNEKEDKIIENLKKDIETTLSNWFDSKGNVKDLSTLFLMSMSKGHLHFHLPLFVTPATGFIHSRIYQSLVDAYKYSYCNTTFFHIDELGCYEPERDWSKLSKIIYPDLCGACADFENYIEHIFKSYPYYSKWNDGLIEHSNKVIEEYMKIVGDTDTILKTVIDQKEIGGLIAFIHAIHHYLKKAIIKHESAFNQRFVLSSKFKAGIYKGIVFDGKGLGLDGIKLPKGPSAGDDED